MARMVGMTMSSLDTQAFGSKFDPALPDIEPIPERNEQLPTVLEVRREVTVVEEQIVKPVLSPALSTSPEPKGRPEPTPAPPPPPPPPLPKQDDVAEGRAARAAYRHTHPDWNEKVDHATYELHLRDAGPEAGTAAKQFPFGKPKVIDIKGLDGHIIPLVFGDTPRSSTSTFCPPEDELREAMAAMAQGKLKPKTFIKLTKPKNKKQKEGYGPSRPVSPLESEVPPKDHLDARDSTQADIEVHPGPWRWVNERIDNCLANVRDFSSWAFDPFRERPTPDSFGFCHLLLFRDGVRREMSVRLPQGPRVREVKARFTSETLNPNSLVVITRVAAARRFHVSEDNTNGTRLTVASLEGLEDEWIIAGMYPWEEEFPHLTFSCGPPMWFGTDKARFAVSVEAQRRINQLDGTWRGQDVAMIQPWFERKLKGLWGSLDAPAIFKLIEEFKKAHGCPNERLQLVLDTPAQVATLTEDDSSAVGLHVYFFQAVEYTAWSYSMVYVGHAGEGAGYAPAVHCVEQVAAGAWPTVDDEFQEVLNQISVTDDGIDLQTARTWLATWIKHHPADPTPGSVLALLLQFKTEHGCPSNRSYRLTVFPERQVAKLQECTLLPPGLYAFMGKMPPGREFNRAYALWDYDLLYVGHAAEPIEHSWQYAVGQFLRGTPAVARNFMALFDEENSQREAALIPAAPVVTPLHELAHKAKLAGVKWHQGERNEMHNEGGVCTRLRHESQGADVRSINGAGVHGLPADYYEANPDPPTELLELVERAWAFLCDQLSKLRSQSEEYSVTASCEWEAEHPVINLLSSESTQKVELREDGGLDITLVVPGPCLRSLRLAVLFVSLPCERVWIRNGRNEYTEPLFPVKYFEDRPLPQAHPHYVDVSYCGRSCYPPAFLKGNVEDERFLLRTSHVYGAEEFLLTRYPLHVTLRPAKGHPRPFYCANLVLDLPTDRVYYTEDGLVTRKLDRVTWRALSDVAKQFTPRDADFHGGGKEFEEWQLEMLNTLVERLLLVMALGWVCALLWCAWFVCPNVLEPTADNYFYTVKLCWFLACFLMTLCHWEEYKWPFLVFSFVSFSSLPSCGWPESAFWLALSATALLGILWFTRAQVKPRKTAFVHSEDDYSGTVVPSETLLIPTMGTRGDHVPPRYWANIASWAGVKVRMHKLQTATHDQLSDLKHGKMQTIARLAQQQL